MIEYLAPFTVGLTFMTLAIFQQVNSAYGHWRRAFFFSLLISSCAYFQIRYAATDSASRYAAFALGAAVGSSLGNKLGHKYNGKGKRS